MKASKRIDHQPIGVLDAKERASLAEIGKRIAPSGPAIGERLRHLHGDGMSREFGAKVDPRASGCTLQAIVRIKPRLRQMHLMEQMIFDGPRVTSCD